MISFIATIEKFGQQGEKTGWTYIIIPSNIALKLKPGNKRSFRVKGMLDDHPIARVALMPMGAGDFILALNASMRKGFRKNVGAKLSVQLEVDTKEITAPRDLIECLKDEPPAWKQYNAIALSHQRYFIQWIGSAKTETTKAKRIAQTVMALAAGKDYGAMLKSLKKQKEDLF